MAHQFNKDIAYIENTDNPNTLNILPVDNAGKCMTLDGTKEWNFNSALPVGSKWIEKLGGSGITNVIRTTFYVTGTFTWTPNADTKFAYIKIVGGGAGGFGALGTAANQISIGASGMYAITTEFYVKKADLSASHTVVVGTGGSGGSGSTQPGDGQNSSISGLITALGGVIPTGWAGVSTGVFATVGAVTTLTTGSNGPAYSGANPNLVILDNIAIPLNIQGTILKLSSSLVVADKSVSYNSFQKTHNQTIGTIIITGNQVINGTSSASKGEAGRGGVSVSFATAAGNASGSIGGNGAVEIIEFI